MKRKPVFSLKPEQVMKICREMNYADILGGEVLALMSLMVHEKCTMLELSVRSRVARSMISKILSLQSFPTTRILNDLVTALGSDLGHFFVLAGFEVRAKCLYRDIDTGGAADQDCAHENDAPAFPHLACGCQPEGRRQVQRRIRQPNDATSRRARPPAPPNTTGPALRVACRSEDVPGIVPGIPTIAPGVPSVVPGVPSFAPGVPSFAPGVASVAAGVPSIAPGVPSFTPGVASVAPGVASVAPGVPSVVPGVPSFAPGVASFAPGVASVAAGVPSIAPGVPGITAGDDF